LKQVLIILFLSSALLKAQVKDDVYTLDQPRDYNKDPARTATFIELGGNGSLYSVNFDEILFYGEKFKVSGRLGAAVFPNGYHIEQAYVVENNYILFSNPHHLELGPSVTLQRKFQESCSDTTKVIWESLWYGMFRLGYRYQKQEDGFFFRVGILGIPYKKDDCGTQIPPQNKFWVGISIGISY
jgi:hypothetical protein